MVMEDYTTKEIREMFTKLLDIVRCAVCLETVRLDMVQCTNNHLICNECKVAMKKQECPSCSAQFSPFKPSIFTYQVVEVFPTRCKYNNCPYYIKRGDEHEKYCGYKPTNCKECQWIGPSKDIQQHFKNGHEYKEIIHDQTLDYYLPNVMQDAKAIFSPILIENQFFWEKYECDPERKLFSFTYFLVPNGKPKNKFFVNIVLASEDEKFNVKIRLNLDPDVDPVENTISVPWNLLKKLVDEEGDLSFFIQIRKE